MTKIIGIDLGTTNSCVSIMEGGEPKVIENSEGNRTTPSIVAFTDCGERLVGQAAKRQSVTNPDRTVFAVRRLIGRKFGDPEVQRFADMIPFEIVEGPDGDAAVKVADRMYSPLALLAMILRKMKLIADEYYDKTVTKAVFTVPAHFDLAQIQAVKDAGKIANLNVVSTITDSVAASLAYGLDREGEEKIAVFDLGGGTFDISILEIGDGVFEVKSTNGDTFLGGEDFDLRIVNWLADEFKRENGIDLRGDKMALQRLKEEAEKAKKELSTARETDINLPFITADAGGPKHLHLKLSRARLEALVEDLIDRCERPCRIALQDAELSASDIDAVILVGGMTRMPKVREKVKDIFGKEPRRNVNPDEAAAMGAAIQGAVSRGDVRDVLLLDVLPLSLGLEIKSGMMTKLIEKNTAVPTSKSQIISTASDNQPGVSIHVLQGEHELARHNKSICRFDLTGIPPAPRGVPQIEVTLAFDPYRLLSVSAKDLGTGKELDIHATALGLSEAEIERMKKDVELGDE